MPCVLQRTVGRRRRILIVLLPSIFLLSTLLFVDPTPPTLVVHAWSTTAPFSSACSTRITATAASSSSSVFLAHKNNHQQQQKQRHPTTSSRQKAAFLNSLDVRHTLNAASPERTRLLQELCAVNPTPRPGSTAAWAADTVVVVGEWRVVYAPHMDAMGRLLRGRFAPVIYQMSNDADNNNNKIVSHARVKLPFLGSWWFSVSGTYGSVDQDRVCRVNFDEAWVRRIDVVDDENDTTGSSSPDNDDDSCYYPNIDAVPESPAKEWIRRTGRTLFVEAVAVFPVSYLDHDLVVFDFELLGTRICALKQ